PEIPRHRPRPNLDGVDHSRPGDRDRRAAASGWEGGEPIAHRLAAQGMGGGAVANQIHARPDGHTGAAMGAGKTERLGADSQASPRVDVAVDIKIADACEPGVSHHGRLIDTQIDAETRPDVLATGRAAFARWFRQQHIATDGLDTEI